MGQRKWEKTQIALLGRIFLPNRTYALARVRVSPSCPITADNSRKAESEKCAIFEKCLKYVCSYQKID